MNVKDIIRCEDIHLIIPSCSCFEVLGQRHSLMLLHADSYCIFSVFLSETDMDSMIRSHRLHSTPCASCLQIVEGEWKEREWNTVCVCEIHCKINTQLAHGVCSWPQTVRCQSVYYSKLTHILTPQFLANTHHGSLLRQRSAFDTHQTCLKQNIL